MNGPFHSGELELQKRAGVLDEARAVGRIIGRRIPAGASTFLRTQRFAVASSLDATGRVWASLLNGPAGFIEAVDEEMIHLSARPILGDPLVDNLVARPEIGLLVFDPRTRRRMRFNGRGLVSPEGIFLLVDQAYSNCPKYIQRRALEPEAAAGPQGPPSVTKHLGAEQQEWILQADTFFMATFHPEGGADASHRGGFPGFVRVLGPDSLAFDDYPGNGMFNTLGNLVSHPAAGLLFVDFAKGDLLQLTGKASVSEDFSVRYDVESVRETPEGSPLRWSFVEYSPANPSRPPTNGIQREVPARVGGRRTDDEAHRLQ